MKLPRCIAARLARQHGPIHGLTTPYSQLAAASLCARRRLPQKITVAYSSWWSGRKYATAVSATELQFGQPVHETHPHILKAGEITPGITAQEYHDRRAKLALSLPDGAVAVLAAAELKYRSGPVFFPFRQESNFLYLTGFSEPEAMVVIQKTGPRHGDYTFHLLCRPKDPQAEQWSGPWSGLQAAQDVFNADVAGDISNVESILPPLVKGATWIYTDIEMNKAGHPTDFANLVRRANSTVGVQRLQPLVNRLRAIKSSAEIANMRKAGQISGRVISDAMRRDWKTEKELETFLNYQFTVSGCDGPAYVPVVAGGPRGCGIHYVQNNAMLDRDDMVLVDAGGEYGAYITDISRTWPLSGRFSPAQRDLYLAVLKVQRSVVSLCRESSGMTLDRLHRITEDGLRDQLTQLGFDMSGNALQILFPHHVGHYVGLDVHDVPGYGRHHPLKSGHCVTVEPGVYVPKDERWPKHFRGMAVRIEDSVCVDDDSPFILTTEAVKEVEDIEALRD
ncbi:hypothetical protein VTK73DRAFT_5817 [Phialemonium thermophilum]|uniref:Xaa-Pro aminopeptidase n=1 Tax=Phialemonium thermophilum TaxID=223376 RepID=A0ABR3WLX8_9PEZI